MTLSGTTVGAGRALALLGASLAVYVLPLVAVAAIALLLSTVTHNSAAAVVGALMISLLLQLVHDHPRARRRSSPYLLPTQFNAWQGFLREPIDYAPVVRAVWVCALYAIPCLAAACAVLPAPRRRRRLTGLWRRPAVRSRSGSQWHRCAEAMHPNARLMPMVTALMVGLVAGTLARSALVAALAGCLVLFLITATEDGRRR